MNTIFKNLPLDCVNYILGYDNRFSIRRGIIVNKLLKTDKRYTPLLSIPNKYFMSGYMCLDISVNITPFYISNADFFINNNNKIDLILLSLLYFIH